MQFTTILAAAAAFTVASAAKFANPSFAGITAGSAFNISWIEASGPVTINLKNGPSGNLKTVNVIASGLSGSSYTWSVPSTLPSDTYALEIVDGSGPNYSTQFELVGGAAATTSSASASASMSSSSNSTTSASTSSVTGVSNSTTTTGSASGTRTTGTSTRTGASSSGTSTPTSPPGGSSAVGLTSNLALVFLALGAFMTLN